MGREIPNVYTGLAPVDMSMLMPKTGLAVNLPNALGGGFNMRVVLPRTKMTMDAEHPASYELTTSPHQDLIIALASSHPTFYSAQSDPAWMELQPSQAKGMGWL